LDTSASPPTPTSLISQIATKLTSELYTNPHSTSYSGTRTAEEIDRVRKKVMLDLFGVKGEEGWDLVFTSGTTAGIKLIGECFFGKEAEGREYVYLDQAHTSLVGVRGYAEAGGRGKSRAVSSNNLVNGWAGREESAGDRLVGIPAQCNASGRRYFHDQLFPHLRNNDRRAPINGARTYYLLDAAAYLSSSTRIDLSTMSHDDAPDYVVFSCYKLYGYPTGIGGLLIKRQSSEVILRGKTYFGGGTVDALAPRSNWAMSRRGVTDVLEDGSVNVHGIIGVGQAEDVYDRLFGSLRDRSRYVKNLLRRLVEGMADIKHDGGQPVIKIYMESQEGMRWSQLGKGGEMADQGPIVNFNILHPSGRIIPPSEVDRLACIQNIHLRSGRHCNAGFIVNHLLNGSEREIIEQYDQGVGCDQSAGGAVVTASLRVSLGIHNTPEDVDRFLDFVRRFWKHDKGGVIQAAGSAPSPPFDSYRLEQIMVYPIKSCAAQSLAADQDWPLTPHGLEHDREWILVDRRTGKGLSQKKYPRMALVRPRIDLDQRVMVVQAGQQCVTVDLDEEDSLPTFATSTQVCVDTVTPTGSSRYEAADQMLSDFLGLPCALARQVGPGRHSKLGDPSNDRIPLLLSNESPFLLLNDESVRKVTTWIQEGGEVETVAKAASFRGNFVIDRSMSRRDGRSDEAFAEDSLYRLSIGPHTFIPLGACRRCQMVSIDQETGEKAPETFLAIAKRRRDERGRILFGTHLMWRRDEERDSERPVVRIGMDVTMIKQ
jgi:molybdenum cofactor sulfurtransferase